MIMKSRYEKKRHLRVSLFFILKQQIEARKFNAEWIDGTVTASKHTTHLTTVPPNFQSENLVSNVSLDACPNKFGA